MNLYQIDGMIQDALAMAVDPETGEINEEYMAALDALEMQRDRKIENIICLIKNFRAEAAAIKAEKEALQKRQKAAESRADSLARYLSNALNGERFTSPRGAVTYRKGTKVELNPGVTVYDIDTHYIRMKEPELDKTAIAKALKEGQAVEGVHLEETVSTIIK